MVHLIRPKLVENGYRNLYYILVTFHSVYYLAKECLDLKHGIYFSFLLACLAPFTVQFRSNAAGAESITTTANRGKYRT